MLRVGDKFTIGEDKTVYTAYDVCPTGSHSVTFVAPNSYRYSLPQEMLRKVEEPPRIGDRVVLRCNPSGNFGMIVACDDPAYVVRWDFAIGSHRYTGHELRVVERCLGWDKVE